VCDEDVAEDHERARRTDEERNDGDDAERGGHTRHLSNDCAGLAALDERALGRRLSRWKLAYWRLTATGRLEVSVAEPIVFVQRRPATADSASDSGWGAYCCQCGAHLGVFRVRVSTIFGIEEDERVMRMARVY
jgi:hypothetical protein